MNSSAPALAALCVFECAVEDLRFGGEIKQNVGAQHNERM